MRDESPRFSRPVSAMVIDSASSPIAHPAPVSSPQGHVLRGRYGELLRSSKGKIKGLILHAAEGEVAIKLPKYLRPMLVRELQPGAWVQVWASREDDRWRGMNLIPWPETEVPQALKDALVQSATVTGQEVVGQAVVGKHVDALPSLTQVQDDLPSQESQLSTKHESQKYGSPTYGSPKLSSKQSATTKPACIQVCRKGKCFRQGGQRILQAIQSEVEANPDLQHITVEGTGCMGACKQGPNLRVMPQKKMHSRVTPDRAIALLAHCQ
ncbi:MAG: hypothetical protein RLZZ597_2560 [Cyanobacteriota bacterium]